MKSGIQPGILQQFPVCPLLDNAAGFHDDDIVGIFSGVICSASSWVKHLDGKLLLTLSDWVHACELESRCWQPGRLGTRNRATQVPDYPEVYSHQ